GRHHLGIRGRLFLGIGGRDHFGIRGRIASEFAFQVRAGEEVGRSARKNLLHEACNVSRDSRHCTRYISRGEGSRGWSASSCGDW
ncbi:hypothetical protein CN203_35445, partial [Sinorhizobium meliloti]